MAGPNPNIHAASDAKGKWQMKQYEDSLSHKDRDAVDWQDCCPAIVRRLQDRAMKLSSAGSFPFIIREGAETVDLNSVVRPHVKLWVFTSALSLTFISSMDTMVYEFRRVAS
jgi:hypothetical protein